jgi:hypothetical protein
MSSAEPALATSDLRIDAIERVIVAALRAGGPDRVLACAVVDAGSPLAAFGRAIEAARFPEYDMAKVMEPWEPASLFLYTVDVERGRIGHVKRLVRGRSAEEFAATGRTGLEVLDDRVDATDPDEQADLDELLGEFDITDTALVWNIATSCATERVAPTRHRPYSLLTYKGLLLLTRPIGVDHFYAYINKKTVRSMGRLGIPSTLLGGREYHLPVPGGYDHDYVAIHMVTDEPTVRAFTVVDPARPLSRAVAEAEFPVVVFVDDDQVLDLTDAAVSPHVSLVRLDEESRRAVMAGDDMVIDLRDGDDVVIDLRDGDEVTIDLTDPAVERSFRP